MGFFPELNISIALATNIETDKQASANKLVSACPCRRWLQVQTPDALCLGRCQLNHPLSLTKNERLRCFSYNAVAGRAHTRSRPLLPAGVFFLSSFMSNLGIAADHTLKKQHGG